MSIADSLINFARRSGAQAFAAEGGGVRLTWDMGHFFHHLWKENDQYCYGTSERSEPRIATMLCPYEEIIEKWAIVAIGAEARRHLGFAPIVIPSAPESAEPHWRFEQLSFLSGRLATEDGFIPMELRDTFPRHRNLTMLSHVIQMDADQLLSSYEAEDAHPLLSHLLPPAH
ncbi:hypothetical protein [Schaalia hyovaginalis]|uniref:Uncharacterized protein n=1 Tax=Schaalia hyovaginalis TaxID=29316 RepID=A0A923E3G7_9ACTO|nr:hypothetical protein [Schaalia hyovaginalis]MBB6333490.1 hypothetical protein [Schaalia hyovaginalis]MDY2669017.1 hypothetical protein [Schaalia hyovaginalis]MDY6214254.1 hypothetical protein [Schaalia hyovaginalis]